MKQSLCKRWWRQSYLPFRTSPRQFFIGLADGQAGIFVWKFTTAGGFKFAGLIPGRYESGVHGGVTVTT
jgi:hypothetical protein